MKKIIIVFALLLCLLLCGCAAEDRTPYLSDAEREQVESQLINSMEITLQEGLTSGQLHLKGDSKYDIYDLLIWEKGSDSTSNVIKFLPKGSVYLGNVYLSDEPNSEELSKKEYYLRYSIGDYSYRSDYFTINHKPAAVPTLEIYVETESGPVLLTAEKTLELDGSHQPEGLSEAKLKLLTLHQNYYAYNNKYSTSINIELEMGSKIVYYKLRDSSGLIHESGRVYALYGSDLLLFSTLDGLAPGRYSLSFYEKE